MENLHLPGGYDKVLEDFAKKNNLAVKTAFYNLIRMNIWRKVVH